MSPETLYVRCYSLRPIDGKLACLIVDSGCTSAGDINFKAVIEFAKKESVVPPARMLCLVPKERIH